MKKILTVLLLITAILTVQSSCSKTDHAVQAKTFVLVHGAWQGAYVWQFVKDELEKHGQKVITVELPAHGTDTTSAANVTINSYRDKVIAAIKAANTKVILVGHSLGGMVVTATAESIPDKIEKLIYIAAFVPGNGQRLVELAGQDAQSQLGPSLIPSATQPTLDVIPANRVAIFCQDGSATVKQLVLDKFRVEPAIPFGMPVFVTAAAFGQVDKYYIHTTADQAIGITLQKQMASAAGITKVYSLNSGHSPFLSMPDSLADMLMTIIK
ncbi:MAG: alpha/beta hydrolase [Ferruginibacter sp.]|nr:alpha/beta hydrolase [Ferruginibacter sp.]